MKSTAKLLFGLAALATAVAIPSTAFALPGRAASVTVWGDRGGYVIDYALKMLKMKERGDTVRFAGRCDSACTLYLALPASRTCVTQGANFGFHLPYGSSAESNAIAARYMMRNYPGWVRSWISAKGGLSHSIKTMDYAYASRHLPTCATTTPRAAAYAFAAKPSFTQTFAFKPAGGFSLTQAFEGR